MTADRRLLLVHAHPDDETIGTGASMARYAHEGVQVTLVTCTLGELGEILVPELAHLASDRDDALGEHRVGELAAAMDALGVTDHRFLGGPGRFRDSGMIGTPENADPRAFWNTPLDVAVAELVAVIREVRPQVVVTYDPFGGYGHPDHLQAHRVTEVAVTAAADGRVSPAAGPAWRVAKLYWTAIPKSVLAAGIAAMKEAGATMFDGVDSVDDLPMGTPDDQVTTEVDARDFLPAKIEAMKAHATQITVDGPFFALSNNLGQHSFGTEYYTLARGELGDRDPATGRETDLFAGL